VKEYVESEMAKDAFLHSHVFQVLVPMEQHAVIRSGKRVVSQKVSMPGYLFFQADIRGGEVARKLRFMPNVLGFLGGMDSPSPVPQTQINRMLGSVEENELGNEDLISFIVGEPVKVVDGPFSGFNGTVEEIYPEKHKLKVMVMIFGRQNPLELNYTQVEKEG